MADPAGGDADDPQRGAGQEEAGGGMVMIMIMMMMMMMIMIMMIMINNDDDDNDNDRDGVFPGADITWMINAARPFANIVQ